ncbi:MAG: hypothetical protein ACOYJZ_08545 [Acutalibacter sp.]|jgi:hypothetical protein
MKLIRWFGGWRPLVLRVMGWVHCAMIFALFYGAVYRVIQGDQALPLRMWWGLLYVIPIALADVGSQLCRGLLQYLPWSLGCCLITWPLLSSPFAVIPVVLVCFFRGKNSLSEDPVESLMDKPTPVLTAAALAPFFYSALDGSPLLQRLSLIWAALYLLLCGAFRGFLVIDRYLNLNRGMSGLPVKRILRTSGLALVGMLVVAGGLLIPALAIQDNYLRIDPNAPRGQSQVRVETPDPVMHDSMDMTAFRESMDDGKDHTMPVFVQYLLWAVVAVICASVLLYLIYMVIRNFRGTFVDHRDVVQFLSRDAQEQEEELPAQRQKRPALWDRSPTAQVRRKYRRTVLRTAKERPPRWAAPQEIEETAGLSDTLLHSLYEKARYSQEGCTAQENRSLKR